MKILLVFLLIISQSTWAKLTIHDARFWSAPDKTRLVLDINKKTYYRLKQKGSKVILTINSVNLPKKAFANLQKYHDNRLKKIFIKRNKSDLELLIDVTGIISIKDFTLVPNNKYPHNRLVIDFYGKDTPIAKPVAIDKKIIFIDPGHGGEDPGAIGKQSYEKVITLSIAKKLAKKINQSKHYRAILSRKSDYGLRLSRRVRLAQRHQADLFISIHADSAGNKKARGSSVYTLSAKGASTKFAKRLELSENAADQYAGVATRHKIDRHLNNILRDFSRSNRDDQSQKLALAILTQLKKTQQIHKKNPQKAGFVVLKTPAIPSVLVETAFISNYKDEQHLNSKQGQYTITEAIFKGIKNYYQQSF